MSACLLSSCASRLATTGREARIGEPTTAADPISASCRGVTPAPALRPFQPGGRDDGRLPVGVVIILTHPSRAADTAPFTHERRAAPEGQLKAEAVE